MSAYDHRWHEMRRQDDCAREARARRIAKSERERKIVRAVLVNLDDPDFTFGILCERFAASDPAEILHTLRKNNIRWSPNTQRFAVERS